MKKILYVTTIGTTINAFLVPHIEMLINKGYKVDCACFMDVSIDKSLVNKGTKVFNVPFTRKPFDVSNIKAFKKLIEIQKKNNYDILHVHTPVASVYGRLLKMKFPNLKIIYTAHGFHFYKGASRNKWILFYTIEKFMSKFTDILITMNSEDYKIASNRFKAKKVVNINGVGVDIEKYALKENKEDLKLDLGLNDDDLVITVVAELSKRKNQMQIIYAIEKIITKYKNIKLLLVGNGDLYNDLNSYIVKQNLVENIKLLGYREDIPKILNITDIVGLFSHHEGLPRNLMEAMVAKKPIICTNIRGNNDLVENFKNGFLVEVNDIDKTIVAIERLYNSYTLRTEMGINGFEIIRNKYSIEVILKEMEKIY